MPLVFAYGHFLAHLPREPALRPERARLVGYRASFCARSTDDWGTPANPAPLLALGEGGSCRGWVVELPEDRLEGLLQTWSEQGAADMRQEGEAEVGLPFRRDPARVRFVTVDPRGPQALKSEPLPRLARMCLVARGRKGTGLDYLNGLIAQLREWGIEEPAVTALSKEVQKERGEGWR